MALLKPAWMQAASGDADITYSAQQDRAAVLGAIFSREGVIDPDSGALKVSQRAAGANFSVDIALGRAVINGDDVSDQGPYIVTSTASENRTVPSAPASGTRVHRVVARVKDKLHNGLWTGYDWTIEVLPDTGSGTPAVPASAIPLARVSVAAGQASVQTAHITDDRPYARAGTSDRAGVWSLDSSAWGQTDPDRPLTWRINPDGWVSLAGWVRRVSSGWTQPANTQVTEGAGLPVPIRPATRRDFIGITTNGPVHWSITPAGEMQSRYTAATSIVQNVTWLSFDGCGYRI